MNCFHTATFQTKAAFLFSRSAVRGSLDADRPVPFPLPFVRRKGDQGGGSPGAEPGRLVPPPSECLPASEGPCRGRVPPNLFGRSLAGGVWGVVLPAGRPEPSLPPEFQSRPTAWMATPIRRDGGLGGKGGRRVDTCFSCPRGGTGAATAGHERIARIKPGEWHQVARRSGWLLCFPVPAVGRTPGWVGRWCSGRSGRSGLPRPRAVCGASRRILFSPFHSSIKPVSGPVTEAAHR